ncbi:MAG: hypothetical protein KGQ94_09570, partial [Alphaproteobacteria bacterium]|nr:hypothetical protein [Alphaproteobacteria bacterium]
MAKRGLEAARIAHESQAGRVPRHPDHLIGNIGWKLDIDRLLFALASGKHAVDFCGGVDRGQP